MIDETTALYLSDFIGFNRGASEKQIKDLHIDFDLPNDYIEVMKVTNGGDGEVGENNWLFLFPIEKLVTINNDYALLMEQIPDYFLFGKDAADTGFAFHKANQTVHSFGLMSNFKTDSINFYAQTFTEFLKNLYYK